MSFGEDEAFTMFGYMREDEEDAEEETRRRKKKPRKEEERSGIVDWNAVFKELSGKVVLFEDVKKLVKEQYGKVLSSSEWEDQAERISLKGRVLVLSRKRRIGNRLRRLWYIKVIEFPFDEGSDDYGFPGDGVPWNEIFKKKVNKQRGS